MHVEHRGGVIDFNLGKGGENWLVTLGMGPEGDIGPQG